MLLTRTLTRSLKAPLLVRNLSSAALPEKAPITMFGTAGRYANALYAAAAKKDALGAVLSDMELLKETLSASPALANFCSDPSLGRDAKAKGIREVLASAKANEVSINAMATLAEGGRLGDAVKVIDMYTELITAAKGEVQAVITSAEALPPAELEAITKQLYSFLDEGQSKLSVSTKVDAALVSGITVEIGDKFLDYSVATQLKKLQQLLKDGI